MMAAIIAFICLPVSLLLWALGAPAEAHLIAPALVVIGALGAEAL